MVWGFSFWDDENVLELDKGYSCITYVSNTKLCTLKMGTFMLCEFYPIEDARTELITAYEKNYPSMLFYYLVLPN